MIVLGGCGSGGCGASKAPTERYSKSKATVDAANGMGKPGLLMGDYVLRESDAILDGDTVKIGKIEQSLRLLGIDTEETFKNKADKRTSAKNFESYLIKIRGDSPRPQKAATPMGEAAKEFAKAFFKGSRKVRLERDDPKEIVGMYGRYLSYIFANKDGTWVNYNVECVRAGMSPYFMKYGYSNRFHDEFVAAEKEARAAKRGIWSPDAKGYRDYDERITWWKARGNFVREFDRMSKQKNDFIALTDWDAIRRIEDNLNKHVTVLATVDRIKFLSKGLTRVDLARRQFQGLPVIFFDRNAFNASGIADYEREFVTIRGKVGRYKGKVQLEVRGTDQVQLSNLPTSPKNTK